MSEETKKTEVTSEGTASAAKEEQSDKKKDAKENALEVLVAILLGITALLSAWSSWIGSLHGGNQATNYTKSNNIASEGNAEYNAAMQLYLSDLMAWNTMLEYSFDHELALSRNDTTEAELIDEKMQNFAEQNCSEILLDAIGKMDDTATSPFSVEGTYEKYFVDANALIDESQQLLEQGMKDNSNGDAYNLVNVIYSLVLFLLGIVGIFKKLPNRTVVFIVAAVGLILATVYMFTIPMPTGFDFTSYFTS